MSISAFFFFSIRSAADISVKTIAQIKSDVRVTSSENSKKTKPPSIIQSIKLRGLLSKMFITHRKFYILSRYSHPLGITKLKAFFTTEKSMVLAPRISPSIQIGIGASNSILK